MASVSALRLGTAPFLWAGTYVRARARTNSGSVMLAGLLLAWAHPGHGAQQVGARPAQTMESECARCHAIQPAGAPAAHSFADWRSSPHAAAGVGCEACHRGNPSVTSKTEAHRGVRRSSDRESPIYFSKIPSTCGRCHEGELSEFQRSLHFRELQATGRGPNCVTCHGSMAIRVLTPDAMQETCSACHNPEMRLDPNKPIVARYLLALTRETQLATALAAQVAAARARAGRPVPEAEVAIAQARRHLENAFRAWHGFHLTAIEQYVARASAETRRAEELLGRGTQ